MNTNGNVSGYPLRRLPLVGGVVLVLSLGVCSGVIAGAAPPDVLAHAVGTAAPRCSLTQERGGDPFYRPNTPLRSHVGTGFALAGIVRSGIDCSAIRGAHVEFWLRGPDGQYDSVHRGTVITDGNGRYRFESNFPGGDVAFRPHIHLRVAVPGYRTLVTVYLPRAGASTGTFDLVLEPEV